MKTTLTTTLVSLAIVILSCTNKSTDTTAESTGFILHGHVTGFADSTWLFLQNQSLDSTMVLHGEFTFTGKVTDSIKSTQAFVRTKNFSDYKFLWLENSNITFNGKKGAFRMATITGSTAQLVADAYDKIEIQIMKGLDSIATIAREPELAQSTADKLDSLRTALEEKKKDLSFTFIKDNPNSIISAYILDTYASTWGRNTTTEFYNLLSAEMQNSSYGKKIKKFIALNKDINIGDKFVDFGQVTQQGVNAKLSNLSGKVVLLEFWASWCGPCRRENPALVKTYKTFKEKGFEIFAVSLDDNKEQWLQAIEKDNLPWINVSELTGPQNSAALIYGISGIPDNFLIDKTGTIIERNLRGEKLWAKLNELLK